MLFSVVIGSSPTTRFSGMYPISRGIIQHGSLVTYDMIKSFLKN